MDFQALYLYVLARMHVTDFRIFANDVTEFDGIDKL